MTRAARIAADHRPGLRGGFVVAWEADNNGAAWPPSTWLRFGYYPTVSKLLGAWSRGTLIGFSKWTAKAEPTTDAALQRQHVTGDIGDRDFVS